MVIWIIFGALIAILILFFAYSAIKDRRNKKKLKQEKLLFEAEAVEYYDEILITMIEIIENNQKFLDEFEVSIGKYKMGQITDATRNIIGDILNSSKFKGFFIEDEKYIEFVKNVVFLKDLKSNNWQKKAISAMEYFKKEFRKIEEGKIEDIRYTVRKEINKKYHEKLVK